MEALGKLFMSLERLTGLGFFADLGRPLLDLDRKKKDLERNIANTKSSANAVKQNFEKIKPKDKVS